MTDADRLAAMLHEAIERLWCTPGEPEDVAVEAARLIAAGVTVVTHAPLDVPSHPSPGESAGFDRDVERLAAAIRANWYEIRPYGGAWVRPADAAEAILAHLEGPPLAATPAPLDAHALYSVGVTHGMHRHGEHDDAESCHEYVVGECLLEPLAATPAPLAPHPGRNHEYRMTCLSCGEPGHLFVGFHSPGETFRWSEAQPKEADRD